MEAKLKTATCARCKARKTRCDGKDPCISCSKAAIPCEYEPDARESRFGFELGKGRACLACRRKKKRCDGQLPCRTCVAARKRNACEYADGIAVAVPPKHAVQMQTHVMSENSSPDDFENSEGTPPTDSSSPDSARPLPAPVHPITVVASTNNPETDSPSSPNLPDTISSPMSYTTLAEIFQARDLFLENTEKRGLPVPEVPYYNKGTSAAPRAPTINDLGDPHSPSPFFEAPLPTQDDAEDLTYIRKVFLDHRTQLGLSVQASTLEAIATGVTDDGLHPSVLHACQLLGYMLVRHLPDDTWVHTPTQCDRERRQLQLTLGVLHNHCPDAAPTPLATLQTLALLSSYFFSKGDIVQAREMILASNTVVREHNLDAPDPEATSAEPGRHGFNIAPTSTAAEIQAAVSRLVFLDLSYAITLKLPSIVDPALHDNFKALISRPNAYAETNFVRAKSVFLLFEAQRLAERWSDHDQPPLTETEGLEWQSRYWDAMEMLDAHRSYLTLALTKMAFCPTHHTMGLSLKVCQVVLLTGLTTLLSLFSAYNPELAEQKLAAVNEIVRISRIFTEEDCKHLDPILSVCWTSVIGSLDHCIALGKGVCEESMHSIPAAMAGIIRQRNKTLQRVLPFAADV
ncbi:hypothetical protein B0H16DRAFT_788756 [Mycena metata]|uniref:Zn(2)-C6 fungal-type domain-containing protein n=1 Tax=Mycena metata TaxID=1033252 RepID=A0AAD7IXV4_9AGAR|nr:hypothetical protein B0H16DRAFT_788756 [Mycena metata]